ncbi:prostatic acid phosphatase-like [Macrosteles quadrilineatus]|uniref:prostatic acid phosphatase-like n=1 Tax=Macrosteles quadrilineatus TaxID=74068 RepID=UPI0023E2474E|nr:prostatic acid phosphatase-like [Macrosteles quadrilineatus]
MVELFCFRHMFTFFIVCQAVCIVNSRILENELGEVIFANVLFRHGDRTPIDPYPTDPFRNTSFWPVGFGQLTNTGKEQHFELGQWLRNRYDALLTEQYSRDMIYVRSTDVDRTLMSAECNLAGLYPPKEAQVWNENINWQPIPVHTVPDKFDNLLAAKKPCPAYEEEFNRLMQTEEMQALNNTFIEVYKVLNQNAGEQVTTIERIDWVYNTLWVETLYNFSIPEWTKSIFPHPMAEASKYSFVLPTWTKKLARLKSGLLVKEMITSMKDKKVTKPKPKRNLNMYSAHDTTVSNLLHTLGVYNMINPPYTVCFMMELRVNSSGDHLVTMFYRNSSSEDPYLLTLPGCSAACPLDQFIKLLEPVSLTVTDWEKECKVSIFSSYSMLTIVGLSIVKGCKMLIGFVGRLSLLKILAGDGIIFVLVVLVVLIIVLLAFGAIYWTRRKRATYCKLG